MNNQNFNWSVYPETETFLIDLLSDFKQNNSFINDLSLKMYNLTSTRMIDWIDHICLPEKSSTKEQLESLGYHLNLSKSAEENKLIYQHLNSTYFPIILQKRDIYELVVKVEEIENFVLQNNINAEIFGKAFAPYRKALIARQNKYLLCVIERRGYSGFSIQNKSDDLSEYSNALNSFTKRKRNYENDIIGLIELEKLIDKHLSSLNQSRIADAFFRCERTYWQSRNSAGQIQKNRQDQLGLGWANHDHHTYRSNRETYTLNIRIFEKLGFNCREKFFAGEIAGWGAQVLEHPECDIVIFADVDISDKEKDTDFSHTGLKHQNNLKTVGLWVSLHGECLLQAGMHHLESRFDFNKAMRDLNDLNIPLMKPFSNSTILKQVFTEGENWSVSSNRLKTLLDNDLITLSHFNYFNSKGAIGSHLEILERNLGYKGFNQNAITQVLNELDPRKK